MKEFHARRRREMDAAIEKAADAIVANHKRVYGDLWDKVDFLGVPRRDLPQEQREAITARLNAEKKAVWDKMTEQQKKELPI